MRHGGLQSVHREEDNMIFVVAVFVASLFFYFGKEKKDRDAYYRRQVEQDRGIFFPRHRQFRDRE